MGEFFRGWRRKIGVLTLVMACVFMGGWIRSQNVCDSFSVNPEYGRFIISSGWGQIHLWRVSHLNGARIFSATVGLKLKDVDGHNWEGHGRFEPRGDFTPNWRYDWAGFHVSDGVAHQMELTLCFIPYWSITIPLTLLSAFLLLSKPGKSTPKKNDEPTANEGV